MFIFHALLAMFWFSQAASSEDKSEDTSECSEYFIAETVFNVSDTLNQLPDFKAFIWEDLTRCERHMDNFDAGVCLGMTLSWDQDYNEAMCKSELPGEDMQSGCTDAYFLQLYLRRIKSVNELDWGFECFLFIHIVFGVLVAANHEGTDELRSWATKIGLAVIAFLGLVCVALQIVALEAAFRIEGMHLPRELVNAGCFNYEGDGALRDMAETVKSIRILGIFELGLGILDLLLTAKQVEDLKASSDCEKGEKKGYDWFELTAFATLTILNLALASIDHWVFGTELGYKMDSLFFSSHLVGNYTRGGIIPCVLTTPVIGTMSLDGSMKWLV